MPPRSDSYVQLQLKRNWDLEYHHVGYRSGHHQRLLTALELMPLDSNCVAFSLSGTSLSAATCQDSRTEHATQVASHRLNLHLGARVLGGSLEPTLLSEQQATHTQLKDAWCKDRRLNRPRQSQSMLLVL